MGYELNWFGISLALLYIYTYNLRNYLTTFLHIHIIAYMEVEGTDEILII